MQIESILFASNDLHIFNHETRRKIESSSIIIKVFIESVIKIDLMFCKRFTIGLIYYLIFKNIQIVIHSGQKRKKKS